MYFRCIIRNNEMKYRRCKSQDSCAIYEKKQPSRSMLQRCKLYDGSNPQDKIGMRMKALERELE